MEPAPQALHSLPLLLCTASRWEAGPIAARLRLSRDDSGLYSGRSRGRKVRLFKTGMGPRAATRSLATLSKTDRYLCALSVGFAGALEPGLKSGDLVAELPANWTARAREAAESHGLIIHFGRIAHADAVVSEPGEKSLLGRREGARAVDMETKALRQWAGDRMPVLAVRVILDTLDQSLPDTFPEDESWGAVARYAAGNLSQLPRLASLGWAQKRTISRLSLFLERFLEIL